MARGLNFFRLLEVFTFYKLCFTSVESLRSLPFFCIKMTTEVFYLDISSGHHLIGQPEFGGVHFHISFLKISSEFDVEFTLFFSILAIVDFL